MGAMASVQSPPGCPGFKIRPLKPLAEDSQWEKIDVAYPT